ncbi:hypothetical protein ACLB2K_034499 [Fragaria x ananassa]
MALKAPQLCFFPKLLQAQDYPTLPFFCPPLMTEDGDDEGEARKCRHKWPKLVLIGHRGNGMNMLQSSDIRMRAIKENSILSFNTAAQFPIDFVELDVQVTKDDCPVIFHDNFIVTHDKGVFIEKRVTDLKLPEFLSYGPQKHLGEMGMPLFRKMKDGRIFEWKVEKDAPLCTLQEAFENLEHSLGFNMELKFDDHIVYTERQLKHVLQVILQVINDYAKGRPIFFSTFQPDAALLIRKMQSSYPVYFLTEGGYHQMHVDARKNSLEAAVKVCLAGGLQGIVSEVSAILGNKEAVTGIQGNNLRLLTYGQLNNMVKAVCLQLQMGVDGVIVDLVQEITGAVCD